MHQMRSGSRPNAAITAQGPFRRSPELIFRFGLLVCLHHMLRGAVQRDRIRRRAVLVVRAVMRRQTPAPKHLLSVPTYATLTGPCSARICIPVVGLYSAVFYLQSHSDSRTLTPATNEGRTRSLKLSHTSRRAPLQPVPKTQVPCTPYHPPNRTGVGTHGGTPLSVSD
jgi:hypothetical protein